MRSPSNVCSSFSFFIAFTILIAACSRPKTGPPNLESEILGNWVGIATQLIINTEGRTPKTRTISISEGEWESKMNRIPPKMTYFADHRYQSLYISLINSEGQQVHDTVKQNGTWKLHGDTLLIQEPQLTVPESGFQLSLKGDDLELNATMDMDGDGEIDDKYWMLQRRVK